MRLLKQISLDNHVSRASNSLNSTLKQTNVNNYDEISRQWTSFDKSFSEILDFSVRLLNSIISSKNFNKNISRSVLKSLDELNSSIVQLVKITSNGESFDNKEISAENELKLKSRLRRQYSALIGEHRPTLFRSKRSLSINEKEVVFLSSDFQLIENALENSIKKLFDSKIFELLLEAMPFIEFEEKKRVRIIFTNSLILKIKKTHIVVNHFADSSNRILINLIESYEMKRSDITLNYGSILRFACQFEPIVVNLFQSEYVYKFFQYMQRSSFDCPFDVVLDVFYTFKTIICKHPEITTTFLQTNFMKIFEFFIQLLHADKIENYVTKRQTLEILTEVFSGSSTEVQQLKDNFIDQKQWMCLIISFLWTANLQIRLRCLVLLNKLFSTTNSKFVQNSNAESVKSSKNNELTQIWRIGLLTEKLKSTLYEYYQNENLQKDEKIKTSIKSIFQRLQQECEQSNLKQFICQNEFINQMLIANS